MQREWVRATYHDRRQLRRSRPRLDRVDDRVFSVMLGLVCPVRIGPYTIACAVRSVTGEVLRARNHDTVPLAGGGLVL